MLVHLRSKVVDAHRGDLVPKPEALAMKATAWAFTDARRLRLGELGAGAVGAALARVGRRTLPGGRRALGRLPWPGSRWSDARDLPLPPRESFRAWWSRTRGGTTGEDA